jgi:hypothetical protein
MGTSKISALGTWPEDLATLAQFDYYGPADFSQ